MRHVTDWPGGDRVRCSRQADLIDKSLNGCCLQLVHVSGGYRVVSDCTFLGNEPGTRPVVRGLSGPVASLKTFHHFCPMVLEDIAVADFPFCH